MNKYQHTQTGRLMLYILFIIAILFIFILEKVDFDLAILGVMVLILGVVASFMSLTVKTDEEYLRIKFGYGIFQKRFALKDIISAKHVKNHWYYGWGIRFWFWPRMMIFNVSGFDAVEIVMKNGKVYRIGTDDPEKLEFAINREIIISTS